ncbi:MAG: L,D-transpeptidase catalytic domain [Pseudomonadota bacterium]|jgi:hypothetical protein
MKSIKKFSSVLSAVGIAAVLLSTACVKAQTDTDSEVMWAVGGLSGSQVQSALQAKIAFRLNLKTNRATMYKSGVAVDQWNIASGDVTGEWHNGRPHFTPTGIFNVEDMQVCPAWYPRNPVNPATGRVVSSEQERQRVFAQNPQIYGACGSRNPLGKYVLWFNGAYGMHGNSAEEILELPNPSDRRVSGGCVRNPNAKIKSVFHTILNTFDGLSGYAGQVKAMESRAANDRWTVTKGVSSLDMRVVVGNWATDPAVGSVMQPAPRPTPSPVQTAKPEQPATQPPVVEAAPQAPVAQPAPQPKLISGKMFCKISSVESSSGIAPVYLNVPVDGVENRVSTFYRIDWPVTVFATVEGSDFYKVSRGFIDKKYLSNCTQAE